MQTHRSSDDFLTSQGIEPKPHSWTTGEPFFLDQILWYMNFPLILHLSTCILPYWTKKAELYWAMRLRRYSDVKQIESQGHAHGGVRIAKTTFLKVWVIIKLVELNNNSKMQKCSGLISVDYLGTCSA